MFLDPEPKRQSSPRSQKRTMAASPFSSPLSSTTYLPAEPPSDEKRIHNVRRKPLHERTQSQNNQRLPDKTEESQDKPTVRLVANSPSPPASAQSNLAFDHDLQTAKEIKVHKFDRALSRLSSSELVQQTSGTKQGFPAFSQAESVSESYTSTNRLPKLTLPSSITLLPTTTTHAVPKTAWHRRSGSSGNYSNSSTLKEGDSSFALSSRSDRFSIGTTLRGTPTPYDLQQDSSERTEAGGDAKQGPAHALQTLEETSPERSTIRAVPPSVESSSTVDQLGSGPSESSLPRPQSAHSAGEPDSPPPIPPKSRRRSSASSIPAPLHIRKVSASSAPSESRYQSASPPHQEPFPQVEVPLERSPSPIVVIYDSDTSRPRSRSHPLRSTASIESIQSRLQYPSIVQLDNGHGLTASSSLASLRPSSSVDTLPPLRIPKKRLRHKPASLSLGSGSDYAASNQMASEDYDSLPYPRQQFNSHLSTIASESDSQSRSASRQLSHFSLGSGVLTGDDASSIPRGRRGSAPIDSTYSSSSRAAPGTSSGEEAGDMTLGIYREESAKPQPLFKPRSPSAPGERRKYDGPLPPIPPIPKSRDSDENFDTVSELQSPSLRPKRSGYSLRQRSNSTPSRSGSHSRHMSQISYLESERGSHGSSIFPTWAKHFYGGTGALLSASKISLGSHTASKQQQRQNHARNPSQWTEHSITSRLGTGYSEITGSPTSSHFLPSIFRPRTRPRANTDGNRHSRFRRSKRSRPSGDDDGRPDSLAIFNDPLPQSREGGPLPSGQPRYGELKDAPDSTHRPLPRKYSKQKQWDGMEFPRPMTKDRLSEFGIHEPHLAPSKRTSYRLSTWRAPSFVESLDTLVRSRCNRQILLFALGFVCPLLWMLAAALPLPPRPSRQVDLEKSLQGSEEDVQAVMMKHEAGDAERRWREEKQWLKARWWRQLNRIMSIVGLLVIGAVTALAVVATRRSPLS